LKKKSKKDDDKKSSKKDDKKGLKITDKVNFKRLKYAIMVVNENDSKELKLKVDGDKTLIKSK